MKIVRAEMASLGHIVRFGRRRKCRDADGVGLVTNIENPGQLEPVFLIVEHRFVGHDQKVAVVDDYVAHEWAYITHFYRPFYVYQYATSFTASTALAEKVMSGQPDAVSADAAIEQLGDHVALVLDDGPCRYGQASTVVRACDDAFECLREGVVPAAALERPWLVRESPQ